MINPTAKLVREAGMKYRHKPDLRMIKDCIRNYQHFTFDENSVVLDMGCNIGGFMYWLKDAPIKQYIGIDAYEPNLEYFRENHLPDRENFEIHWGACTPTDDEFVTFHVADFDNTLVGTHGQTNPTKRQKSGRPNEIKTPNFNIDKLIEKYKPTHLKMDIKGTEMLWFEKTGGKLPECVEQFFVEVYRKKGAEEYDSKYVPVQLEEFDIEFVYPTEQFKGMGDWYDCPNLGLPKQNAQIYDINVVLKRKNG